MCVKGVFSEAGVYAKGFVLVLACSSGRKKSHEVKNKLSGVNKTAPSEPINRTQPRYIHTVILYVEASDYPLLALAFCLVLLLLTLVVGLSLSCSALPWPSSSVWPLGGMLCVLWCCVWCDDVRVLTGSCGTGGIIGLPSLPMRWDSARLSRPSASSTSCGT